MEGSTQHIVTNTIKIKNIPEAVQNLWRSDASKEDREVYWKEYKEYIKKEVKDFYVGFLGDMLQELDTCKNQDRIEEASQAAKMVNMGYSNLKADLDRIDDFESMHNVANWVHKVYMGDYCFGLMAETSHPYQITYISCITNFNYW